MSSYNEIGLSFDINRRFICENGTPTRTKNTKEIEIERDREKKVFSTVRYELCGLCEILFIMKISSSQPQ